MNIKTEFFKQAVGMLTNKEYDEFSQLNYNIRQEFDPKELGYWQSNDLEDCMRSAVILCLIQNIIQAVRDDYVLDGGLQDYKEMLRLVLAHKTYTGPNTTLLDGLVAKAAQCVCFDPDVRERLIKLFYNPE